MFGSRTRIVLGLVLFASMVTIASAQTIVFPEWTQRFDAGHLTDTPRALATDSTGNSYVTGYITVNTTAGADQEMMTVKYDSNGHLLWRVFLSSPVHVAEGVDVAVDSAGNVYVLSLIWLAKTSAGDPTDAEFFLTKYNSSGTRLWFAFFNNSGKNDIPVKLAVTSSGHIYVTGSINDSSMVTVLRYDSNGHLLWQRSSDPIAGETRAPISVAFDSQERVYVPANRLSNGVPVLGEVFVYDAAGNFLRQFPSPAASIPQFTALRVDPDGNSYIGGNRDQFNATVLKFDPSGNNLWGFNTGLEQTVALRDLVIDKDGNSYYIVDFLREDRPGKTPATIVQKADTNGNPQTFATFLFPEDQATGDVHGINLALNSIAEVYFLLSLKDSASQSADIVTLKYDRAGQILWKQSFHGSGAGDDIPVAMKVGGDGGLFVTGASNGSGTCLDWVTIDYVQDGASVAPTSLTFTSQAVHTTSAPQDVTVTNKSEIDLNIQSITTSGDFHQTNTCPPHLGAGLTCAVHVTFTPTATGARTGTLTILDDWEGSPRKVALAAAGH